MMRRREVVKKLLENRGDLLVIAGLGSTAWDITAAGDSPQRCAIGQEGRATVAGTTQTRTTRPVLPPEPPPRRGLAARVSLGRVFAPVPSEFGVLYSPI